MRRRRPEPPAAASVSCGCGWKAWASRRGCNVLFCEGDAERPATAAAVKAAAGTRGAPARRDAALRCAKTRHFLHLREGGRGRQAGRQVKVNGTVEGKAGSWGQYGGTRQNGHAPPHPDTTVKKKKITFYTCCRGRRAGGRGRQREEGRRARGGERGGGTPSVSGGRGGVVPAGGGGDSWCLRPPACAVEGM